MRPLKTSWLEYTQYIFETKPKAVPQRFKIRKAKTIQIFNRNQEKGRISIFVQLGIIKVKYE